MSAHDYDRPRVLGLTLQQWINEVDRAVWRIAGVSVHDLADAGFWDQWQSGVSPADMAADMLASDDLMGGVL